MLSIELESFTYVASASILVCLDVLQLYFCQIPSLEFDRVAYPSWRLEEMVTR